MAATLLVVVMLVWAWGGGRQSAYAEAPDAHGYWWRLQSTLGPVLAPPGVPEGGLWVMSDPSGDQAVSAVRTAGDEDRPPATLTLTVASTTGTPTVVACPATGEWAPAEGGAWEERPEADCEALLVPAVLSEDGTTMTVPLEGFGPAVDIVLVPDASQQGFFSVSFEPPADDAVAHGQTVNPATEAPATQPAPPPPAPASAAPPVTSPVPPAPPAAPAATPARPAPAPAAAAAAVPPPAPRPVPSVAPATPAQTAYQPPAAGFGAPLADQETTTVPPVVSTAATLPAGSRQPLALVALALLVGAWWYRIRAAVAGMDSHPLAAANVPFAAKATAPTEETS